MSLFDTGPQIPANAICHMMCGKMNLDAGKVKPDNRKGILMLVQGSEDGLMHLQWALRPSMQVEDDVIVINDAYLEAVKSQAGKRIYILKFTSSARRFFYWMQGSKPEEDAAIVKTFNEKIGATTTTTCVPQATTTSAPQTTSAAQQQPSQEQQALFMQMLMAAASTSNGGGTNQQMQQPQQPAVALTSLLTPSAIESLLQDEAAVNELFTHCPNQQDGDKQAMVGDCLKSAQVRQALNSLTQAVYSEQVEMLCNLLGVNLDNVDKSVTDAVEVLCRGLEAKHGIVSEAKAADLSMDDQQKTKDEEEPTTSTETGDKMDES